MTVFDKAWSVVKTEEDNQCDGTEKPEGCAGDGQLSEGGAWECSSCSESFCSDCINQGHVPKEDWDLADMAQDHANQPGSMYDNMCSDCELTLAEEYIPEFKDHMEGVEAELREEEMEGKTAREDFDRKVSEQPFFGDNRGKSLYADETPHFHSKFNPDWQDTMKSEPKCGMCGSKDMSNWTPRHTRSCTSCGHDPGNDRCTCGCGGTAPDSKKASNDRTFDMVWGIVKEAPTEECKGCGLAHGTPNSEYCSEICEKQNMKKSDDPLGDALENARNTPRKDLKLTKLPKDVAIKLNRRVKDPSKDPLVQRAKKNLDEEKEERNKR